MSQQQLKPFLVGYVSNHYEDIDDALVFAYNEAHAIQVVLETDQDAKFVYSSEPMIEECVSSEIFATLSVLNEIFPQI